MMRQIQKECGRIHNIVMHLLDFSKPKAASTQPVAINTLVNDTLPLVRNMPSAGLMEIPPESKVRPLPTSTTGRASSDGLPLYSMTDIRDSF